PRAEFLELNGLERYERPLPQMNETTSYSASLPARRRWRDERANPGSRTRQRQAILQGAARSHDRSALHTTGGASHQRTAQSHRLSGSAVDDGIRRARPARRSATAARCEAATTEDAGGVRLQPGATDS